MQNQNLYTEEGLIEALKNHQNEAYRHLYLHYRGSLYNIITQIIPDMETANDVLQEVLVTIWQNIDKYDAQKGRLYTWLLNLTRNAARCIAFLFVHRIYLYSARSLPTLPVTHH